MQPMTTEAEGGWEGVLEPTEGEAQAAALSNEQGEDWIENS